MNSLSYNRYIWDDIFVKISWSIYKTQQYDAEFYIIAEILQPKLSGREQFNCIEQATERLQKLEVFKNAVLVWKRYFVSDAINQRSWFDSPSQAAVSVIQQPPLSGTKLAVLMYAAENVSLHSEDDGTTVMKRPHHTHLYNLQMHHKQGDSYEQTLAVFERYLQKLANHGCRLDAHCLRTWLFVQNIDKHYHGMVRARKEIFAFTGLTPQTHFIASTGIEGQSVHPEVIITMDAYSIREIKQEQIRYLHAASNLNPTCEYGVTFERGTCIQYGDRRHIFISGTASIDNQGKIVHLQHLDKQIERMMENVLALLSEAEAGWQDVAHLVVYLRDIADYENTRIYFEKNFPKMPFIILLAPVCRPGWLVEVECSAIKAISDDRFETF